MALLGGCVSVEHSASLTGELKGDPKPAATNATATRLVPVGRDPDGCMMYRLDVPGQAIQAITYRTPEGRSTFDRGEAECPEAPGDQKRFTPPAADDRANR